MVRFQPIRGTRDLFGISQRKFNYIVEASKKIADLHNYEELQLPIFEFSSLYEKSLGEDSDVVGKEMYSFEDKGGDRITLRPEFTAGVCRSFISNSMQHNLPLRFFSYGPLFRYERPQRGRFRQFYQVNYEMLGIKSPVFDAEVIIMASKLLAMLDLSNIIELNLNSLGTLESRKKFRVSLVEYFNDYISDLSEDSKRRLKTNPLRILDSKDENDKKIISNAPILREYFDQESKEYFDELQGLLNDNNIKFHLNDKLVRGLDYYEHTVFEFITNELGSQGTVAGGGRYDGLLSMMGVEPTPAIGFAMGVDRIIELLDEKKLRDIKDLIVIIPIGNIAKKSALSLATTLRECNLRVMISHYEQVSKQFKFANKVDAKIALILGEDEIKNNTIKLKDMQDGIEYTIPTSNLIDKLQSII